ncbi:MAG: SlyX family protein [Deltaproteobacteria bacterium]|nr:SlyX family protein [Deltaproteobacteria bacterium]
MTTEDRIARLEETLFFQERLIQDLNAALVSQQRQIDALERMLETIGSRVEDLLQAVAEGSGPANTPPPHYQER